MNFGTFAPPMKNPLLKQMKKCPTCSEPPVRICRCEKRDSMCSNGHEWFFDKHKNQVCSGKGHIDK
jgi:hypothetical protein